MKTRRKRISGTRGKYFYSVKDLSKKQNLILAFYLYQISIETDDIQYVDECQHMYKNLVNALNLEEYSRQIINSIIEHHLAI